MRVLYLIYVWIIFVPIFLILTILTAVITILGCMSGGEHIFSYYPGMIWSKLTCYLALCPVKVKGREHIRKGQSYIFVANHQGAFDIFMIYGFLGVPIKWVMKAGIGKIPFVGAACRAAGFVFVNNSTAKSTEKSVKEAELQLKKGTSIAIFPEGSRTSTGKMNRFKKGAFQMAVDQHLPVVPITLNGPFDVLPIGSLNLHCHAMEMIIHPPFMVDDADVSGKNLQSVAEKAHQIISSGLWEKYK